VTVAVCVTYHVSEACREHAQWRIQRGAGTGRDGRGKEGTGREGKGKRRADGEGRIKGEGRGPP